MAPDGLARSDPHAVSNRRAPPASASMNTRILLLLLLLNPFTRLACAAEAAPDANTLDLQAILAQQIVGPAVVLSEVQDYLEPRVPEMPPLTSAKDWTRLANH